jgi:uncharacterized protein YvpB
VRAPVTMVAMLATLCLAFGSFTSVALASPTLGQPAADEVIAAGEHLQEGGSFVWVPNYVQQRNLSCEYAAVVIAMGAFGTWVSEYDFDGMVGWSENPHWGYRGDITGWWGNTEDYGVYASALVPAINAYGFWADEFYAAGDASALTQRIDGGAPVIVWLGLWGDTSFYNWTEDGTQYKLASGMHVVVAYGYDDYGVWVSDPANGTKYQYDWGTFMTYWNVMDGMGLAVGPM